MTHPLNPDEREECGGGAPIGEALDDLIAKLKAATEGSSRLDEEIAHRCGMAHQVEENGDKDIVYDPPYPGGMPRCRPLRYTTSLDAALTLVPEGLEIRMTRGYKGPYALAAIHRQPRGALSPHPVVADCERSDNELALAVCIAAIQARAAQPQEPK